MLSKDNQLIYRNTLIIYARMLFVTFVGLFSSRFVLQALGASDYGLYNVVGGLIAMLNFISTAMVTTTRRFVNVEMGKPDGNINKVFNICLLLHIGFALLILVIAETLGIWYINNMLNVAPGKENDAMFVFQISTIVACIGIINVPYQSLIEAHEFFGKAAIIDILTTAVKFAFILVLLLYSGNALRFYAISICLVTLLSFALYHRVCKKKWADTIRWHYYGRSPLYKEILVFNNYTALGAIATIGKSQGSNLLVNFFFGTIVNAAFAIAYQVESYVYMFVNKISLAANPQVAKNYSGGSLERVNSLIEKNSKYSILIMTVFFFTIYVELDYILSVWLKEVPPGATLLCQLTLIDALVRSFSEGTNGLVHASGKIKWFQIVGSIILLSNLPLGFMLFKIGFEAHWIIICFIATSVGYRGISLYMMHSILKFDVKRYFVRAYLSPILVIGVLVCYSIVYNSFLKTGVQFHVLGILLTLVLSLISAFILGLDKKEKEAILSMINKNSILEKDY